jgi:Co/Zn/Cd efflux system component
MNIRAALIHILGDMVQSIGVIAAALILKFKTGPEW